MCRCRPERHLLLFVVCVVYVQIIIPLVCYNSLYRERISQTFEHITCTDIRRSNYRQLITKRIDDDIKDSVPPNLYCLESGIKPIVQREFKHTSYRLKLCIKFSYSIYLFIKSRPRIPQWD